MMLRIKLLGMVGVLVLLGLSLAGPSVEGASGWTVLSLREFSLIAIQGMPHSISPDGEFLLTWNNDTGICLYRTEDLSPLDCFKPELRTEEPIWLNTRSIAWAPDGRRLVFASIDGELWLIDVEASKLDWLPASIDAEDVAWSPDGEYLAVGGGGCVVVAPPGALAEAPVACSEGILKGLVWNEAGLYYGILAPDRRTFQLWSTWAHGPMLLWSYPYPDLFLQAVSPDGRYAWVGADLVDLERGDFARVRQAQSLDSFAFSPDGRWWLYTYSTVLRDETIRTVYRLAIRPAGAPEDEEQVLLESDQQIAILGWAASHRVALFLVHRDGSELLIMDLIQGR